LVRRKRYERWNTNSCAGCSCAQTLRLQLEGLLKSSGKDISSVIDFAIDDEIVKERIGGRWVHKESGRSYHIKFAPPKVPFTDDQTGEKLIQRSDDKPETVGARLKTFHEQTAPVLDFYRYASVELGEQSYSISLSQLFAQLQQARKAAIPEC
jgi:adenylate kinase family enzyme